MFARKFLTLFFEGLVMHLPFVTKDEDAPVSDVATAVICFYSCCRFFKRHKLGNILSYALIKDDKDLSNSQ